MRNGTNADGLAAWLACLGPLGLYLATLTPGVAFWDVGEMQTVPYLLGIAHPTGFPLVVLAGWLFAHAVPVGEVAWRMSLFCAIAASVAAAALHAFVREVTGDARVGVASALAFALGDIVWRHAVRADVHDVALAALAVGLAAAARAGMRRDTRALAWAAFACGCGLAIHPIAALALPCALAFAWPALRSADLAARLRALALGAAPLLAYAYVPLRSAYVRAHDGDPGRELGLSGTAIFDSGSPATPAAFWRYVTGAEFAPLHAFARASSATGAARTLAFAHDVAYGNDGVLQLAFALVGLGVLATTAPRIAAGFVALAVATLGFVANYPAESDLARYALAALWALGACAGIGAWWLARAIVGGAARRGVASLAAASALLGAAAVGIVPTARDVGMATRADDARALAATVERLTVDGSLVIASWNYATPLAYETYVARRMGTRRLACGWPYDFAGRYPAWRARYRHIYFVLARDYAAAPFARAIAAQGPWQLAELKS